MFTLSIIALVLIASLVVLFVATFTRNDKAGTTDNATHNTTAKKEAIAMKNFELVCGTSEWTWGRAMGAYDAWEVWRCGDEYIEVSYFEDQPDMPYEGWVCKIRTEDGRTYEFGTDSAGNKDLDDLLTLQHMGIDAMVMASHAFLYCKQVANRYDRLLYTRSDLEEVKEAFLGQYDPEMLTSDEQEEIIWELLKNVDWDKERLSKRDQDKLYGAVLDVIFGF